MKQITFILAAIMLLAGCQKTDQVAPESMSNDEMANLTIHETPIPLTEEQIFTLSQVIEPIAPSTKSPVFTIRDADDLSAFGSQGELLVVYFWASWCGPCKLYTPRFTEVAGSYDAEECLFGKVDYDNAKTLSESCRITILPTTLFIKDLSEVARLTGACSTETLKSVIEQYI